MKIFSEGLIKIDYYALDKKSLIREMAESLQYSGYINEISSFLESVFEREGLMSTGIGHGVAIPHARSSEAKELKICVFLLKDKIEFDSIDESLVDIIFLIAVPESLKDEYIKVLSAIANFCRDENSRNKLRSCSSIDAVYRILKAIENEI